METFEIILLSAILLFFGFVVYKLTRKSKVVETPFIDGGGGDIELPPIDGPEEPIDGSQEKIESEIK